MEILAFILFIGVVIAFLLQLSSSSKGAAGEARVNSSLRSNLNSHEYYVLTDLTLPTKGGTTQIDHIVLSRNGIFVVETKNMSGWIFGDANKARWTQVLHRHKTQFQNPLRQNYGHLRVVQDLLGIETKQLHNVVVFAGSAEPKTDMPENVLWDTRELSDYIRSRQNAHFSDNQLRIFKERLNRNALDANRETNRAHIKHVKAKVAEQQNDKTKCPRCTAKMVERSNRKSGEKFLGCSRFPKCKGTREI
ncbi:MAG: nuclease [Marinosulfonomonas sp.]|nr:MAG: nuclease [Marinosulfonomonas sp.]